MGLFAQKGENSYDRRHNGQELNEVDKIDRPGHPDFEVADLVSYLLDLVFYGPDLRFYEFLGGQIFPVLLALVVQGLIYC